MRPTVDAIPSQEPSYPPDATESLPDDFMPGAKLVAGYVRYVCILPALAGDDPDTICCRTRITRSGPGIIPYLALSYAWGDPTPKYPVLVDGERRLIAENLWQFLREASTKPLQFSCWLWIDALSIDQSDTEERRHQVGVMSTIFSDAFEVVVWLGQELDDSDIAIRVLSLEHQTHMPSICERWSDARSDVYYHAGAPGDALYAFMTDEDFDDWAVRVSNAVVNLCQRPFWKRLWVFQELRHAKCIHLMCGRQMISWEAFRNLWTVMAELRGLNEDIAQILKNSLSTKMMTLRTKPMDFSLWNLLKETKDLECADERDRVYALLSVATKGHEEIEADYHASLGSLGHNILRNKYALRRPMSLDNVMTDCNFLREVLKLSWTEFFGYGNTYYGGVWVHKVGSPGSSFAGWAEHHRHPAVTKLLLDTT
jgi:hypothetical protein